MQNEKILEALRVNAEEENPKYSFVIDNNQIDKIIGNVKNNLEINNYIIKNVNVIFNTAQVVIIRSNTYNPICGWESSDSALMFSCIKKIYKGNKLIFSYTEE